MPIAQIFDVPGASARDYEQARAPIQNGACSHATAPTPDGGEWAGRDALERCEQQVLAPLGSGGAPRVELPVHQHLAR